MKNIDFQTLFESAPGLYLILLPNFKIVAVSDSYLNATMTKREDITGRELFDVFPDNPNDPKADGASNLRFSLHWVVKNKVSHAMEIQKYDIRRPNGKFEIRYWSLLNLPVLNKKNELTYIIHKVEDVTEKIINERRFKDLNQSEEKLRSISGSSPDLMNTVDNNGIITYSNRLLDGFKSEDVVGQNIMKFIPNNQKQKYYSYWLKALKGQPQEFEIQSYGKNRELAWYSVRMSVENSNGKKKSVLIVSTDITGRREGIIREKVINNISKELNNNVSLNVFLNKIRLELGRIFNTENFYVSSYNKHLDELTFVYHYINNQPEPEVPYSRINGNGLSEYVIKLKKGLLLQGEKIVPFQNEKGIYIHMDQTKSWLGVPLMFEKEVVGVLAVLSFQDNNAFKEKDKELLNFVGTQIGAYIGRKLAQERMKESEERYKRVVQDQTEYIVRWKPTGEIIFANKSYIEFNETSKEELYKRNYFDLIPPTEKKRFDKKIKSLTKKNPVQIDAHQGSRGKAGTFWHEWVDRSFFDEQGKVIEYQSVGRDITKQKEAELEIRKSEEFKESILSALISGIAVIDKNGIVLSTNENWNKFSVASAAILLKIGVGENYLQLCTQAIKSGDWIANKALNGINEVLNCQFPLFELEYPSHSLFGTRWFLMRVSAFKSDAGGAVIAHYDITEKKQKEEELREYKNNLEKLVETRTSTLNEVNQELEAFNYSVSHDLRTPIRAIDIYTGLLSTELQNTELHSYVKQIEKCTAEMNELIKVLMEFSKMNKVPIKIEKIHLNAFIFHAFEKQKVFENVQNTVLKMEAMPVVLADSSLLTIVFNNLLSNAIKYSAKSKAPTIEIGYTETEEKYIIYIKDNGIGFNSKLSEKLFKPFSRLHHGDEFKGTGAGLAIVERIIKRHNGKIYAESQVNHGAVFYFTLPKKYEHITK